MTFTDEAIAITDVVPQSDAIATTDWSVQALVDTDFTAETFEVS